MNTLTAPTTWVESVGRLRLPGRADRRLSELMDRNTEGQLNADERDQLEELVELSETLSLIRTQALKLLGQFPECSVGASRPVGGATELQ